MFKDAMTVMQEVVDVQSRAMLTADMALMRSTVLLPYRRITANLDTIIETVEDLERDITSFHMSLHSLGVNHLIRLVAHAEYLSENYIEGQYVTHALRNAAAMVPSYDNRLVLHHCDREWRMIELESDLVVTSWPLSLLRVAEKTGLPKATVEDDVRRSATSPITLYQDFVDALTAARP